MPHFKRKKNQQKQWKRTARHGSWTEKGVRQERRARREVKLNAIKKTDA